MLDHRKTIKSNDANVVFIKGSEKNNKIEKSSGAPMGGRHFHAVLRNN